MKIVLVHNSYQRPGGEDTVYHSERTLLRTAGHHVVEYQRSNHEASQYVALRQLLLAKRTIWAGDTRREFRELLRREKPDIVHVHNTFMMISPSIYWACRDERVPIVQSLHNYRLLCPTALFLRDGQVCEECMQHGLWRGVRYGCYRGSRPATAAVAAMLATHRILGTWSRLIDCYLVPTEFGRGKFIEGGLPPDKLVVKPNFVDPDPGEGGLNRTYALFVGRLSQEKGLRTLLAAWERLRFEIPLQIIGDGPMEGELKDYVRQHRLSGVSFWGSAARDQVMAAVKRAICLILPSESYEGMPMIAIEAFACGTPVVASRLGAMASVISNGRTGLHFAALDAEDLARKTEWAWAHPEEILEMGRQARREYEAQYTATRNYTMLLEVYQRAIRTYDDRNDGVTTGIARRGRHVES
jgi:glycosyltransferase involved in cell wall biosynthesis